MSCKTAPTRRNSLLLPKKGSSVNMTEGSILKHILSFAIPVLVGSLFQQLYNMVDTWVVGNYVSNEAFSAVGSVGPIINMLIGFFTGLAAGAGVVISQNYGAKHFDEVSKTVHTAVTMTSLLGIVFTFLGIFLAPLMLQLMNTPEEVIPASTQYLQIYFAGILGLMIYNIGAGILRAVGDSTRPFYYLIVSALMNIGLDLLFVLVFHMGVAGVAWATIISQGVSSVLVMVTLARSNECIKLSFRKLTVHWNSLKRIVSVGLPASIQMAITAFSNIFVQSYINYFGADFMSGWAAYTKIDQLLLLPVQAIALSVSTFVGQNLGAGHVYRAKKGINRGILMTLISTAVLMTPIMLFPSPIVAFFNAKPEVIDYGAMLLLWLSPFYLLTSFNQVYVGALRGAGNTRIPTLISLGSFVVIRQIYLFVVSRVCNEALLIGLSYPFGWIFNSLLTTIYYYRTDLLKTRIVVDKPKE